MKTKRATQIYISKYICIYLYGSICTWQTLKLTLGLGLKGYSEKVNSQNGGKCAVKSELGKPKMGLCMANV